GGGGRARDRALARGAGRLRRQLRRDLWRRQPGMPHPRFYGTFPRVIGHYVGQIGLLTLEAAVHKMTGATARALRLADRGLLRPGWRADVTLFHPADFNDRAPYGDPPRYPSGERPTVLGNGPLVVRTAS